MAYSVLYHVLGSELLGGRDIHSYVCESKAELKALSNSDRVLNLMVVQLPFHSKVIISPCPETCKQLKIFSFT